MKICLNCQIEFEDNYNFCSNCGLKLKEHTRFETLGSEYYLHFRGKEGLILGGNFSYCSERYFRVFIFEDRIFYIRDFKIISEDILSGEIRIVSELNNCSYSEDDLAIYVNSYGIFVYTRWLEYLYFIEHSASYGKNISNHFASKRISKFYICNSTIFYLVESAYPEVEVEVTVEGNLPKSVTKQNSRIESFDVIKEYTDIALSSTYLPNVYVNPAIVYSTNFELLANDDFLVYGVELFAISEGENYIEPNPYLVIVDLKTKEVEYLDTGFRSEQLAFFDTKNNKLIFRDWSGTYSSIDIKTKEVTMQNKAYLEIITYYDGADFLYVDESTFYKVDKQGNKSSNWRDGYETTHDCTFMKTKKWLILPNYIGDSKELQVYDATRFERPEPVYKTRLLGL